MVLGNAEYRAYPQYPETAGSQHGNYSRRYRKAHSADRTYNAVHKSAGKIEAAYHAHSYKTRRYNVWTRVINAKQRCSEKICGVAEDKSRDRSAKTGNKRDPVYTAVFFCSHILADKGKRALRKGVHGDPYKALYA